MAVAKKTPKRAKRVTAPEPVVVSEIGLVVPAQYVFVSNQGVQLADGVSVGLKLVGCEEATVIQTDNKHRTTVVEGLKYDGDKIFINASDFGEGKSLFLTATAKSPDGFALSACASVFKVVLEGLPIDTETDVEAQAAVIDDFYESMNKDPIPLMQNSGVQIFSSDDPTKQNPRPAADAVLTVNADRTTFVGADKRTWAVTENGEVLVFDSVADEFVRVDDDNEILDNLRIERERLVGVFNPAPIEHLIASIEKAHVNVSPIGEYYDDSNDIQFGDEDCEDCNIVSPRDQAKQLMNPVPEAQLHDWSEITDEKCRIYAWADRELRIDEPRAIFYKKDQIGWSTVVLDDQNVAYDIPAGFLYIIRHRVPA